MYPTQFAELLAWVVERKMEDGGFVEAKRSEALDQRGRVQTLAF
jgi:hypothetical protein